MKEIRESKHDYFENLDRQLSSVNDDSKLFRKTSKQVLNLDKSSSCVTTLKMYNEFAENNQAKAEMLNLYFVSQTRVDSTHKDLPFLEPALHSLNSIEISVQDVMDVLLHLNLSKSSGPNKSPPFERRCWYSCLSIFYRLNRSIDQGYYPYSWKEASVSAISKNADKSLPNN